MMTRQTRSRWIAAGLLTAATFCVVVRPADGQGYSSGSSGGGFSGSSSGGGFSGSSSGGGFSGSSGGGFSGSSGGGFTGSSSGAGFTGSSSGMGFTGSTSGTGFTGTSTGTSRTGTGASGTNQVVPQASDPFQTYYANPYKFGMTSTTGTGRSGSTGQFGTPLYGNINTPKTTTTTSGTATSTSSGFNTVGVRRAPSYTTTLGFAAPVVAPAGALQVKLGTVLQASPSLNNSSIQVAVNGATVILRGSVANENERRLAEGMVRLEPGVRDVRNELRIAGPQGGATP